MVAEKEFCYSCKKIIKPYKVIFSFLEPASQSNLSGHTYENFYQKRKSLRSAQQTNSALNHNMVKIYF